MVLWFKFIFMNSSNFLGSLGGGRVSGSLVRFMVYEGEEEGGGGRRKEEGGRKREEEGRWRCGGGRREGDGRTHHIKLVRLGRLQLELLFEPFERCPWAQRGPREGGERKERREGGRRTHHIKWVPSAAFNLDSSSSI
jgi:hypothetical protein